MNMKAKPKLNLGGLSRMSEVVNRAINPPPPDAEIDLDLIDIRRQVRTKKRGIEEFAANIKVQRVKTPIILHAEPNGRYRLIAGERRYHASRLAGFTTIPARIERGLTEREIRAIQVAENNERENLTAYDQAMGVIEDVRTYGVQDAMVIWNRSEGWISKRVSVQKYDTRIVKLMDDEVSDDLELLQALNHILTLKPDDFFLLEKRIREGQPVSREEARVKLASIKAWMTEQHQLASRRQQVVQKPKDAGAGTNPSKPAPVQQSASRAATPRPAHPDPSPVETLRGAGNLTAQPEISDQADSSNDLDGGEDVEQVRVKFQEHLQRIFALAGDGQQVFAAMRSDLVALDCTKDQTDWTMWSGFLTLALPLLSACGTERTAVMLKRLQAELKEQSADQLWDTLHPVVSTQEGRQPIPVMPEDWRL